MKRYLLAVAVLVFGVFGAGLVIAADGMLNAVSFAKIPTGAFVVVRPWDNSDDNMRIAREFESVLKQKGYRISTDTKLILSFETKNILGKWDAGERRHLLEVQGSGGRNGGEKASAKLNLFSSKKGGVFNEGEETANVEPSKYVLDVTLEQKSGPRLWQGQATAALRRDDSVVLIKSMVPIVVDHFGKTIRRKPFDLK